MLLALVALACQLPVTELVADQRPNILFILADDLGYGDLGCYGQREIQTPNLDRLADEGLRFRHFYAGSTVCAPIALRFMTGLHMGHARIRGNALVPLADEDLTVAEVLRATGYETCAIGKWGLGEPESSGLPTRQGFDSWFGYLNQVHAHNYYPDFLWRNETREAIAGNVVLGGVASQRTQYSHDLFTAEALAFLERPRDAPFFLYLAYTIPHANNEAQDRGMEVPDDAPYSDRDWPRPEKNKAAMIGRLDRDVGRIMVRLAELGLDERTIVFFSSDNGPHREGGVDPAFFHSSGPLRGIKRDLYEGGIRVPLVVRWPGRIAQGSRSDLACAAWDFLPTAAELAGTPQFQATDGLSLVPTLLGEAAAARRQDEHEYLYWEFFERGFQQAVRLGPWKGLRLTPQGPLALYDLRTDPGESRDLAGQRPDIVERIETIMRDARTESADWPVPRDGP